MVKLTYRIDEVVLTEDSADPLGSVDAAVLQNSYFVMPVRFQVDGKDLLSTQDTHWFDLPLVDLAVVGLERVLSLKTEKRATYDLPESGERLGFVLTGEMVEVLGLSGQRVPCAYEELVAAFREFSSEVKRFLKERAPALRKHSYWGEWLDTR